MGRVEHGREPASRIVLVSHSPWSGGAERALAELAEALAAAPGRSVQVVLPGAGVLGDRLQAGGIATTVVPGRWWARDPGTRPRLPDLSGVGAMMRTLRGLRPDVVMSNTMVHPPGAVAARALGLPHLWWVHEFGERDHGYRFLLGRRATVRAIGRLSALVLAASGAVKRELERNLAPDRLRLLEGAVAVAPVGAAPAPASLAGRRPRLVLVGRVRPSKGPQDAVRAVHHLARAGAEVELDVVGDGEQRHLAELRALAERLGVAERVRLTGALPDPVPALDSADVVLVCSRDEAFGRVTVEAMKRGRPVVGARAGHTPDLIDHGVSGLLYPPGDAHALAGCVAYLLGDDERRAAVARGGWERAADAYSSERLRREFLALADEVVSVREAPA